MLGPNDPVVFHPTVSSGKQSGTDLFSNQPPIISLRPLTACSISLSSIAERKTELLKSGHSAIGYASWPKGRLFGFRADPEGWIDLNLDPKEGPHELRLNYSTSAGGSVRVGMFSMDPPREWQNPESSAEGYGLADAIPLTGDGFDSVVTWRSGSVIKPIAGKRWLARIHLDSASVHAFGLYPV